jgi:hypothetical protein
MIFRILIGIGDGELVDGLVESIQRAHFRKFARAFVVRNFRRWSGLATNVQRKSGFFLAYGKKRFSRVAPRVSAKEAGIPRCWKQYRLSMLLLKN